MTDDDVARLTAALEREYDLEEGFLGLLRGGHLDTAARDGFIDLLESIDFGATSSLDRRVVALLWYMPIFIEWQERRLDGEDQEELRAVLDIVVRRLEQVLGVP